MADARMESVFDIPLDEAEEARLDAQAEAEIDAGQGVPHEKVREWLLKLAKGERTPPPTT
jgi:predicted transcriptional regulator